MAQVAYLPNQRAGMVRVQTSVGATLIRPIPGCQRWHLHLSKISSPLQTARMVAHVLLSFFQSKQ